MASEPLAVGNTNNNPAETDNGEAKPETLDFIREIVANSTQPTTFTPTAPAAWDDARNRFDTLGG